MHVSTPIFPQETLILDDGAMQIYISDAPSKRVSLVDIPWQIVTDAEIVRAYPGFYASQVS